MVKRGQRIGGSREKLIRAALAMLRTRDGDLALSLRGAAKRAGLSPAVAYQLASLANGDAADQPGVRRTFIAAIAEHGFGRLARHLGQCEGAGEKRVYNLSLGYVRFARKNPSLYRIMFSRELGERADYPDLGAAIAKVYEMFREALATVTLEKGLALEDRTMALVCLLHGYTIERIDSWIRGDFLETDALAMTKRYVGLLL